jgi:hypothetical protein
VEMEATEDGGAYLKHEKERMMTSRRRTVSERLEHERVEEDGKGDDGDELPMA